MDGADLAAGIILAIENFLSKNLIYNTGEKETSTMKQWVKDIGKQFGWGGKVINVSKEHLPETIKDKGYTSQLMVVNSSAIRAESGYSEPVSYTNFLRKTIKWELNNPPKYDENDFNYNEEDQVLSRITV